MSSRMRSNARAIGDGFVRRMINLPNSIFGGFSRVVNQSIDNIIRPRRSTSNHHNYHPHHYPDHTNFDQLHQQPVNFPFQNPPALIEEEWAFLASFEQQNGTTHPFFYACRFVEALKIARDEHKLMFVYIHSREQNPFVASFCRDTLCSEVVVQFLDANFVSWGGLCDRGEGFHMASALKAGSFPFCAVVVPCNGDNLAVMQQIEGPVSADELVEILQRTLDEQGNAFGIGRSEQVAAEKAREDRRVRQEQDAAYLTALKIDQEKESRLKNIPIAEDQKKLPKSTGNAETSRKPDKGSHDSGKISAAEETRILIRFPNGERKEHSFSCKDKIEAIYRYIDSLNLHGAGNYRLISNFPRKVYGVDEKKLSLQEAGLHPKASLFLEII